MAFTEPVWLVANPPGEIRDWWESEYPSITDRACYSYEFFIVQPTA